MSCIVVSHRHINTIVSHASRLGNQCATINHRRQLINGLEQELAQMLLDANLAAYGARYETADSATERIDYAPSQVLAGGDVAVLKLVDGLLYQLGDLPEPEQDPAWQFLQAIRCRLLSAFLATVPDYKNTPWLLE